MGCFSSKNSPKADQHADTRNGVSRSRSYSAPAALQLKPGNLSSFPKENQRYGQRPSLPAFASQNYKGHEQRQSATSSSFPEIVSVQELPKTTDDRSQSPLLRQLPVMDRPPETENHQSDVLKKYGFNDLSQATGGFNNNDLLGEGGFGQVYKATLDGKVVAIKKLKMLPESDVHSGKQPEIAKQFEEIDFLSIVSHQNVVQLIGYCSEGMNRLLVLEYVPNKSLRFHLNANKLLEWSNRMKIAIGSAEGLQYLHDGCGKRIIHRDVKAENILIDNDFEPKVADFSLSKILPNTNSVSHITSILRGTNVYADPEHGDVQKVSEKSDVYSFGVVLLELISGRKLMDKENISIVTWVQSAI
ncbi:proline-rich receptor-like protein kinase PERK1 isoform X2 [Hevea brasiliensis]|uniref:proline-rich receptor-like protein kinase PERK1 isoform X2 n=1 Tax=Hevea brasiliensis TaxID=3981 RepID=UPI0025E2D89F|nr:proline-rich receptor-like protein kinase PERK1 isoform X2 [Hevea brasiliensis]